MSGCSESDSEFIVSTFKVALTDTQSSHRNTSVEADMQLKVKQRRELNIKLYI